MSVHKENICTIPFLFMVLFIKAYQPILCSKYMCGTIRYKLVNLMSHLRDMGQLQPDHPGVDCGRALFLFGTGHEPKDQATIVADYEEFGDVLQDDYIDSYFKD